MQLLDIVKKGSTDRSVTIRIIDSTDGTPETAVEHNTSGIDLWYRREGAAKVSITEAALSALTDAHSDGGIEHIGDGYYRLDLPNAAFLTGANHVDVGGTVTGMIVIGGRVRLVNYDPEDTVRLGLTALPNAAADAAGGLPISDAGGLDLDTMGTNVSKILKSAFAGAELAIGTASQSAPIVTGGPANDIASCLFVIFDNSASDSPIFIEGSYTGSTGACNLNSTPPVTLTTSDKITIVALADAETIGTGTGLTAIPWNAAWDAEVQSEVADALTAYDPPTKAELDSGFAALNDVDSTAVQTACNAALVALHLDHLLAVDYDPASKPGVATALLNELVESDAGVSRFTVNALENGPSGSGASAAAIADAVWTELIADHSGTAGSTAEAVAAILTDTGTTLPATLATLATASAVTTVDTVVDAIKAKTDSLTFTTAGNVDANIQYINDAQVTGNGNSTPWDGA